MKHQAFWVDYLQRMGATDTDWIHLLASDDEVRLSGITAITDEDGDWPLNPGSAYFSPWAMRHEQPDQVWDGDPNEDLEGWTGLPIVGPSPRPVVEWIRQQRVQPTYIQMNGSVATLRKVSSNSRTCAHARPAPCGSRWRSRRPHATK